MAKPAGGREGRGGEENAGEENGERMLGRKRRKRRIKEFAFN